MFQAIRALTVQKILIIRILRLRGIMIGCHFHANMKVQTALKDNNKSKSRAVTCVKFEIDMK